MAQHDYVIANGTGAAVRSDLNKALAAIVSQNSGATAPSTTYAYQWWADTTTGLLKLRNAANNGWITLFQLDGEWSTIALENGSAAAPSIYFKDSGTDTGIYSPGTDQVAISTGGTVRLSLSTSAISSALPIDYPLGAVGTPSITFTGDLNTGLWSPAADTIAASTGGTERLRIDSSGRVGINTAAPTRALHVNGVLNISDGNSDRALLNFTTSTGLQINNTDNSPIKFFTSNTERGQFDSSGRLLVGTSTSVGSNALVSLVGNAATNTSIYFGRYQNASSIGAAGATLGFLEFGSADGGLGAEIRAVSDGVWSSTSDCPSRLVFSTTADGASSPTERMRIRESGILRVPGIYNSTAATGANVWVASDGDLGRSTSSIKYKTSVEDIEFQYSEALLDCRPVWYRSTCEADNPNWGWWGFIAEEVASIDPRLVHWKTSEQVVQENGSVEPVQLETPEPEGVQYDRFVPHLLNLIKRQKEQIEAMEARLSALETL